MNDGIVTLAAILALTVVGVAYLIETQMYAESIMLAIIGGISGLGGYKLKQEQ